MKKLLLLSTLILFAALLVGPADASSLASVSPEPWEPGIIPPPWEPEPQAVALAPSDDSSTSSVSPEPWEPGIIPPPWEPEPQAVALAPSDDSSTSSVSPEPWEPGIIPPPWEPEPQAVMSATSTSPNDAVKAITASPRVPLVPVEDAAFSGWLPPGTVPPPGDPPQALLR